MNAVNEVSKGSTEVRPRPSPMSTPTSTPMSRPVQKVRLQGEIDLAAHDQTLDLLVDAAGTGEVVADLSAVTFIDSSGLRALISAANRVPLSLSGVPEPVEQVLRITGLDEFFGRR